MKKLLPLFFFLLLFASISSAQTSIYKKGMVVCAHPEAAKIGLAVLKKGGNAIDAAVAVQFALAVVYPNAGNIGGGGFMVYRDKKGNTNTLDFREKAPANAFKDMYLDAQGNPIKNLSTYGHLSSGVPGTVDGMVKAHEKYGKLDWKELIEPAIILAQNGFPITKQQADEFNGLKRILIQYNPNGCALIKDEFWKEGAYLKQESLAQTFKLIQKNGRVGFYEGKTAEDMIAEMKRGNGIISKEDLAGYQSVWRKPVIGTYKNYQIISMPPPSSGGIALIQLFNSIAPFPIKNWGLNQDSTVRLITEAERRVYADRSEYLGDPDFYKVPQDTLLSKYYQLNSMKTFSWANATPSADINPGNLKYNEHEETTHFSIVDKNGNAVAITTTLNGSYGSKVFVDGAGFLLNNEMDDFSVKAGFPNMYGVTGGLANAIEPQKRMLSSMTPTIVEKNGKLLMIVGTPGGSTIITSVFQTIINVIEFGMDMQTAVAAKRFHHQWLPNVIYTEENAFDIDTQNRLINKGYILSPRGNMGRVDAILKTKKGYQGGADPRGDDTIAGY
jgi:gamma-glutamyltranspeptidase/glutathione hydrolase